jgi:biopolymer transport protein ExbD
MALSSLHKRARSPIVSEINITPLTDIFLVLLIIFMVTSAAMVDSGADISLPEVDSTIAQPKEITITLTPENDIYVNTTLTAYEDLGAVLGGLLANKPDTPVVLEGDRKVLFGNAVKILSVAQQAGATQIAIAAERKRGG